jgi:hypothetical protein
MNSFLARIPKSRRSSSSSTHDYSLAKLYKIKNGVCFTFNSTVLLRWGGTGISRWSESVAVKPAQTINIAEMKDTTESMLQEALHLDKISFTGKSKWRIANCCFAR